jgi:hypothetical protein
MQKIHFSTLKRLCVVIVLFATQNAFASANFNIVPSGTLPTTVTAGQTVIANYLVTNLTNTARNGYVVQGLPATVTQNTTAPNCGNPINLGPNPANCQMQLDITGAVSSKVTICKGSSCTTSSTPLNVSASSAPNFSYVSDQSSNLWQCPINNATGGISGDACTSLTNATFPHFNTTVEATFFTFSGVTYAYVADDSSNLWQCRMNTTGGFSSGCTALTNSTSPGFSSTQATTFATFSGVTYAYVGDSSSNLWQCPMNVTGGISGGACTLLTNATSPGFSFTNGTTFATFSGITYAYVGDGTTNLWQCPMNATGGFSSGCTALTNSTSPGFSSINEAIFVPFSGVTYAYVADATTKLWQCPMNATGGISGGCTALTNSTSPGFSFTTGTIFSTFSGVTYAYVADFSSNLWQCPMNVTGGISGGCTALTNSTSPGFHETTGVAFFAP